MADGSVHDFYTIAGLAVALARMLDIEMAFILGSCGALYTAVWHELPCVAGG